MFPLLVCRVGSKWVCVGSKHVCVRSVLGQIIFVSRQNGSVSGQNRFVSGLCWVRLKLNNYSTLLVLSLFLTFPKSQLDSSLLPRSTILLLSQTSTSMLPQPHPMVVLRYPCKGMLHVQIIGTFVCACACMCVDVFDLNNDSTFSPQVNVAERTLYH